MKFSNKDILLFFGILVAVVIALTTIVFKENTNANPKTTENLVEPNTSLVAPPRVPGLIEKAIDQIEFRSLVR